MLVLPHAEIAKLHDCQPGSLVRPLWYGATNSFALIAALPNSTDRAVIALEGDGPQYEIFSQRENIDVLSYGNNCILMPDNSGPIEQTPREMYGWPGCLVRTSDRWLLNIAGNNARFGLAPRQYDVASTQLLYPITQLNGIATFGKWTLFIGTLSESRADWIRIVEFQSRKPSFDV